MKLIIDIDEKKWQSVKNGTWCGSEEIAKGTPLPTGHGDLIDVEELKDMLCLEDNDYNRDNNVGEIITLEDMDRLDVVIPADTAD